MIPNDGEFKKQLIGSVKSILAAVRDIRYQSNREGIEHGAIVSHASYSPWRSDTAFRTLYDQIAGNSLVDQYRLYTLWQLTEQACRNQTLRGDILEVGSWRGGSGCLIAAQCRRLESQCEVFLADTFEGVAKAGARDTQYRGGEHNDTSPDVIRELGNRLQLTNLQILQGLFPESTGGAIADRRFRLCHIDVDAYQSAKDVFRWVWPRLEPGGVVVFDDYGFWGCEGVTELFNELRIGDDRTSLYNLTGQGILVKLADVA